MLAGSGRTYDRPEEVFVVSGVFNDGVRDYPAGSFVHSPKDSAHVPQSETGCVLFVFFPEGRSAEIAQTGRRDGSVPWGVRIVKLYNLERSGNCYKIRLFLSILEIEYSTIPVDVGSGEHKTPEFLALNPNGLLPLLVDGTATIYDSAAILAYLARKYGDDDWFPGDPLRCARMIRWLAFEQSEGRYGLARSRAIALKNTTRLAQSGTLEQSQAIGTAALETLNRQLNDTRWLVAGDKPTIADIACYPYTALCEEGGLSLEPYLSVRRWMRDIEKLKNYVPLPVRKNP